MSRKSNAVINNAAPVEVKAKRGRKPKAQIVKEVEKSFRPSRASKVRSFRIPNAVDEAIEKTKISVSDVCHSAILKELKDHISPTVYKELKGTLKGMTPTKK